MKLEDGSSVTKGTSGDNILSADLGTKRTIQELGALNTHLHSWLAHETTISGRRQDASYGEERGGTHASLGISAPGHRLKMRADIRMVGLTLNYLQDTGNGFQRRRKANRGEA